MSKLHASAALIVGRSPLDPGAKAFVNVQRRGHAGELLALDLQSLSDGRIQATGDRLGRILQPCGHRLPAPDESLHRDLDTGFAALGEFMDIATG
ncbi:MAG: hypothetical protein MI920_33070 [Kiloniellales bacterium]|nr:hypothetical protein [Kiloniellales bacterium]